ncbi:MULTISPECIES: spermidine synthase [Legionella]|uniref:Spermidine synthase n=1 Tax=Legionella maceachernii TaxID=466 RepID=A0A0W0W0B1_9GAMM|nr:spermidine synthase [Legionella maceachernii]KTD25872.1 spermidine synthase [Legionella maceachernii]SJZ47435.1 Spermidine synthase [Legionella maceachernii]SUP03916.1 spermidine synthase [Legionella maceachernii]
MWAGALAFSTGLLSLSLEILWVRLFSFANHSLPQAFAYVLIMFLLGIAFGAVIGKRFCQSKRNLWNVSGFILICSSAVNILGPLVYVQFANTHQELLGASILCLTGFLPAVIFPIAHHIGTINITFNVGSRVSRIYVANILGCTLGPLFTMLLLSYFSTQQCFLFCSFLSLAVAFYCFLPSISLVGFVAILALTGILFLPFFFYHPHHLIARLSNFSDKIHRIVENQYGVIVTYHGKGKGDFVFGGNVYDGGTNLDPIINSNKINRVIVLASLQDNPQRILMIGLSIGTWLELVTTFPGVKRIDVVEINPGYLTAMKDYPAQEQSLQDYRVHLYIDDIRRWLKTHPNRKYDLIIMNTTFHWRAYSSYLLSRNFLQILKSRMLPNAILAYNTTDSPDAFKTATTIFPHAYLYENFLIAADFDWRRRLRDPQAINKLSKLSLNGNLLFPPSALSTLKSYLSEPILTLQDIEAKTPRPLEVITDQNLITEYRYGKYREN